MAMPLTKVCNISEGETKDAIVVKNLKFSFPTSSTIIEDFSLTLPKGSRALLCGANGAGKTTLLQILAGKYMVGQDVIRILGRPAFHDLQLASSGELSYLGPQWRRDIAFAGNNIPMQVRMIMIIVKKYIISLDHVKYSPVCMCLCILSGTIHGTICHEYTAWDTVVIGVWRLCRVIYLQER